MTDLVNPKNSLATTIQSQIAIDTIAQKVSTMVHGNDDLVTELELVKYVANQVENIVTDKDADKSTIITNVLLKVFPNMSTSEQIFIKKSITFLQKNAHIKKASIFKYVRVNVCNFIKKRL